MGNARQPSLAAQNNKKRYCAMFWHRGRARQVARDSAVVGEAAGNGLVGVGEPNPLKVNMNGGMLEPRGAERGGAMWLLMLRTPGCVAGSCTLCADVGWRRGATGTPNESFISPSKIN